MNITTNNGKEFIWSLCIPDWSSLFSNMMKFYHRIKIITKIFRGKFLLWPSVWGMRCSS